MAFINLNWRPVK